MRRMVWALGLVVGCSPGPRSDDNASGNPSGTGSQGSTSASSTGPSTSDGTSADGSGSATGSSTDPVLLDLPSPDTGGPVDGCTVVGLDPPGPCDVQAPPDSFTPEVQWSWTGKEESASVVTPLVANLTDDNDDGVVDLCDTPDVLVLATAGGNFGHLYVLDGATGEEHFRIETPVRFDSNPALGDIDGDGEIEIVVHGGADPGVEAVAMELDGTVLWSASAGGTSGTYALADLDNDGDVEVLGGRAWDHEGNPLFGASLGAAPTAADLDDDGDLEIVTGAGIALHHDGTELWNAGTSAAGFPQVADLDDDGLPEVLITSGDGLALIEHDGTLTYEALRPTGIAVGQNNWNRPASIHDFDGDGQSEFAMSSAEFYTVYEGTADIVWSATVQDVSGSATGTAFDFLGDGSAEAMYADETRLFVFDDAGSTLLEVPRSSTTAIEYPVVADVDNDDSAEIVVVSNQGFSGQSAPTVQVIRDADDRWVPARRIWNQHTYHVTNVREDGTIPEQEPPHWESLNTFRTQAQRLFGGGFCEPEG